MHCNVVFSTYPKAEPGKSHLTVQLNHRGEAKEVIFSENEKFTSIDFENPWHKGESDAIL